MTRYRSTLLLVTCVTCLSWTLGASRSFAVEIALLDDTTKSRIRDRPSTAIAQNLPEVTTPSPVGPDKPTLEIGDRGAPVIELQKQLTQLGYYDDLADGTYDENTAMAVSEFQNAEGMTANGIAGEETRTRLQAVVAESAQSSTNPSNTKLTSNRQNVLWFLSGIVTTAAIIGGSILLEKKMRRNAAADTPNAASNEEEPSSPQSSVNGASVENRGAESQGHTNGRAYSQAQLATSSDSEHHLTSEKPNSDETIPLEKTTRLAKIDIVSELIQDLQGNNPQKRRKAIWKLAQQGDSRAIQPLVDSLIDCDTQQHGLILEALAQISSKTLKPMNRALAISLQDDNAEVRKNAIRDLTRIYEIVAQTTQILCHAADDPNREVQETAKWAIGQLSQIRTNATLESLPPSQSTRNLSAGKLEDAPDTRIE